MLNLNAPMTELLRMTHPKVGHLGVEVEWEGKLTPWDSDSSYYWNNKEDGSLRNGGREFVLKSPVILDHLPEVMGELRKLTKGSVPVYSNRTSVHIHYNITGHTLGQVLNILTLFYLIEKMLISTQGVDRKGNLFCLGVHDAEGVFDNLLESFRLGVFFGSFHQDTYKYSALNLCAVDHYGSLEWRFLRGLTDIGDIEEWVHAIVRAAQKAAESPSPLDILNNFRYSDSEDFLLLFFKKSFLKQYVFHLENWRQLLRDNFNYSYELVNTINALKNKPEYIRPYIKAKHEDLPEDVSASGMTYAPPKKPKVTLENPAPPIPSWLTVPIDDAPQEDTPPGT